MRGPTELALTSCAASMSSGRGIFENSIDSGNRKSTPSRPVRLAPVSIYTPVGMLRDTRWARLTDMSRREFIDVKPHIVRKSVFDQFFVYFIPSTFDLTSQTAGDYFLPILREMENIREMIEIR